MKSHPHQNLSRHIEEGLKNAEINLSRHKITNNFRLLNTDLINLAIIAHDFGKCSSYFQKYINKISETNSAKGGELERHSLLSAIFAFSLAFEMKPERDIKEDALYLFIAVKRHHGNLIDISNEQNNLNSREQELLAKQIKSIDYSELEQEYKLIEKFIPEGLRHIFPVSQKYLTKSLENFNSRISNIRRGNRKRISEMYNINKNNAFSFDKFFKFILLYSFLLESDKIQAGLGLMPKECPNIPPKLIDVYKMKKNYGENMINNLREKAYQEINNKLTSWEKAEIYSLTLPTGLGKTLAAYNFALKLRDLKKNGSGITPRIIYSLPFTSIIDQNAEIMEEIFEINNIKSDSRYMIKHHHMADAKYSVETEDGELNYDYNASKLLTDGWNSEIIITTFIQLFESLITNRNRNLRRFHKLVNSIVIIDEIQAIPAKYWQLIRALMIELKSKLNVDIILVTATMPTIFEESDEIMELCLSEPYFKGLNRLKINADLETKDIKQLVEGACLDIGKTTLYIMNTIGAAKDLFSNIKEHYKEYRIGYLSTHVIPKIRRQIINGAKNRKYDILVSTQLIEAGVDIDFDTVYRDFAPIDSLNQSAGRCNRNGKNSGIFNIVKLHDGRRTYASYIYDDIRLKVTQDILQDILKNKAILSEPDLMEIIKKYFIEIKERVSQEESREIIKAVEELRFHRDDNMPSIDKFKLIEDEIPKVNVFIEYDSKAESLWQNYEGIFEEKDYFKREKMFLEIKKDFFDYVISVSCNCDLPPEVYGFRYVSKDMVNDYYDENTGYKTKTGTLLW